MSTIIYNTPYCQLQHLKAQNAILCQYKSIFGAIPIESVVRENKLKDEKRVVRVASLKSGYWEVVDEI